MNSTLTQQIESLFSQRGDSEYGGEAVTQLEHALQCATLAEQEGAPTTLIVAALLHDIGHLLHDLPADAPEQGIDDVHEQQGYRFLKEQLPASVAEPVKLHVQAKRYLCTAEKTYFAQLSEPSRVSLELQGGKMSAEEQENFRAGRYWQEALQLRKWDDQAKVTGLETAGLEHFLPLIDQALEASGG